MATWPTTLPLPNASGYAVSPVDPAVRTDMEAGAARVRRRTRARNDRVTVSWTFSDLQLGLYRDWFDDTAGAAGGSAWFSVSLALGGGGMKAVTARFVNGPGKFSVLGGRLRWSVSAELEVR